LIIEVVCVSRDFLLLGRIFLITDIASGGPRCFGRQGYEVL
jgi:hypothetical protein